MASDENFYDQLNTKVISDAPATEIQGQSDPVHLQKSNKEVLSAIKLVNDATLRSDGGPIPGTAQVYQFTNSDEVRTSVFTPAKGEVWEIEAMSVTLNGRSGAVVHNLFYQDVSTKSTNGNVIKWHVESLSSSDTVLDDADSSRIQSIDSNLNLQYQATGTFTDSTLNVAMYRVR
jgi:hypothetical protein